MNCENSSGFDGTMMVLLEMVVFFGKVEVEKAVLENKKEGKERKFLIFH